MRHINHIQQQITVPAVATLKGIIRSSPLTPNETASIVPSHDDV